MSSVVASSSSVSSVVHSSVASSVISSSSSSVASSSIRSSAPTTSSSSQSSIALSSSSSSSVTSVTFIQAEDYSNMSGVTVETTTDTNGGQNAGSLDTNDWLTYNNVYVPSPGFYTISYRVASLAGGGVLQLEQAGATAIYGAVTIPATGGWQNWTTVTQTVMFTDSGAMSLGIKAVTGGFNLNWFSITEGIVVSSSSSSGSTFAPKEKVLSYLRGITGSKIVFGVENKNTGTPTSDTDQITRIGGKVSGYWGADFGFGTGAVNNRQNMTNEAIRQWNKGAIIQLMWHVCSPTQTEYCGWDDVGGEHPVHLTDAQWVDLTTPGKPLYKVWIARLDLLAGYFQQLKNAGVAPTFRPFHEVNQCAFWWSCHTGANGSARLYQMTHDYLTYTKGLNNIIWNWNIQDINVSALASDIVKYNPGQQYFDIVSLDVYNSAGFNSTTYNAMVNIAQGKPMGIGECMHFPSLATLKNQPEWTFAMIWPDFLYDSSKAENETTIRSMYPSSQVITLDEMPGWK